MFESLFSSENQKLVTKWKKEHEDIVNLAQEISKQYKQGDFMHVKELLTQLNTLTVDHVMEEDIEFYNLLKDPHRSNTEIEHLIKDFTQSFKNTKMALIDFLAVYTQPDASLNQKFIDTFNELVSLLSERIDFEEKIVYERLTQK